MCAVRALQQRRREVEGTPPSSPLQFPTLWLPRCAWRVDWRLLGTQSPIGSLRPTPLGSSGLSLGINSLNLEGEEREEEALLCCLQNRQQTNLGNTSASRVEIQVGAEAGSSPAVRAETHFHPGWGS